MIEGSDQRQYGIYGIDLRVPFVISGASEGGSAVEASVEILTDTCGHIEDALRRAEAAAGREDDDSWFRYVPLPDGTVYLCWSGHFEFLIGHDGRRIWYRELEGASEEALQTYLLGQVLSFALLRLGVEPLHATTVVVEGGAIAIIGESGAGKSTLAASFLSAGYPLLTDDLLVLRDSGDRLIGFPGLPRIKLFPEAADALLGAAGREVGAEMNRWTRKRILSLPDSRFCRSPQPLSTVLFLAPPAEPLPDVVGEQAQGRGSVMSPAAKPEVVPLASRRAFVELLGNTYNPLVEDRARLRRQFDQLSAWVGRVSLASLQGPRDLTRVGELRDTVLAYLAANR